MHRTAVTSTTLVCNASHSRKYESTGTVVWLLVVAGGRLPQRAMLLILAIYVSFAMMSLPMLRCFSFHWRFSRSSILIICSWSASLRWASSNCRRACSRLALARSYKLTMQLLQIHYRYHRYFYCGAPVLAVVKWCITDIP